MKKFSKICNWTVAVLNLIIGVLSIVVVVKGDTLPCLDGVFD